MAARWYVSGINDKAPPLNLKDIASMGPSATVREGMQKRIPDGNDLKGSVLSRKALLSVCVDTKQESRARSPYPAYGARKFGLLRVGTWNPPKAKKLSKSEEVC